MHSFLFSRNHLPDSDSELFNNIILYIPAAGHYLRRPIKKASRKQLIDKLAMKGFDTVVRVAEIPEGILGVDSCPDAQDIAEVVLGDGMQLAVVLDSELPPMDKFVARLKDVETMVGVLGKGNGTMFLTTPYIITYDSPTIFPAGRGAESPQMRINVLSGQSRT